MSTFHELPDHILENVIAAVVDSTRFRGWLFSLRLVNHRFNEAVLHVYYLRKRLVAHPGGHTFDCVRPCDTLLCIKRASSGFKMVYPMRFTFQSLLVSGDLPGHDPQAYRLLQLWREALTILRGVECVQQLDSDHVRFYSTCSKNPIFNDPHSAILCEAIRSYLGSQFLTSSGWSSYDKWVLHLRGKPRPPMFWVALCACVLGDPDLLETCVSKFGSIVNKDSFPQSPSDTSIAQWLVGLLEAAVTHAEHGLVSRMLRQHSSLALEVRTNNAILSRAIFADNVETLKALLEYTPNSPELLSRALHNYGTLLPRSSSGSETIRLLAQHFAPLSAESRTWLITHSCAVGDVTLLEEFSETGPLFDHRIYDACGRTPTYVHFAISCGNTDSLRFLLNHGVIQKDGGQLIWLAIEQALSFNQIECYRELYQRFNEPRSELFFAHLGSAANSEEIMADLIRINKNFILETFGDQKDSLNTIASGALWRSIQRLRPGNIRFLLDKGVQILPWQYAEDCYRSGSPFEIPWPYFNQNRDAFISTQAVLDAFGLPKLRILV